MSTWTAPATWSNGAVTAAQMNTEIRDHFNFVKGALDLLTSSTTADTGTGMFVSIIRGSASVSAYQARISGDTFSRIIVNADGSIQWSHGNDTLRTGLLYHTNSYLSAEMPVVMQYPLRLFVKAGAPVDGDLPGYYGGAIIGMFCFDSTNNRLWVRSTTQWRYVATV